MGWLDGCESAAVTVDTLPAPLSETDVGFTDSVTVGGSSSSVNVSVTEDGSFARLRLSDAVPETVTDLCGASVVLFTPVTVTSPELAVAFAAKVSVVAELSVKSPATAGDTAVAATVTVTATADCRSSTAVTVAIPPFSETDDGDSDSVTCGVSSSVIVRVPSDGFATLLPPADVPETVTDLFPEAALLPFAVTVTVPALVVDPAAMVSVAAVLNVKSAAAARVPAAAATVTVTAALDAPDSVAVTVEIPPSSAIEDGVSTSATVGSVSLSVRVSVAPVTVPAPWPLVRVAVTVPERPDEPWWIVSSTAVTSTVSAAAVVEPAAIVIVASAPTV